MPAAPGQHRQGVQKSLGVNARPDRNLRLFLTSIEEPAASRREQVQTKVVLVSGPNRTSCQAEAGRHGKSGGTAAEAPLLGTLASLSTNCAPLGALFFVPIAAGSTAIARQQWIACSRHSPAHQLKRLTLIFNAVAIFR